MFPLVRSSKAWQTYHVVWNPTTTSPLPVWAWKKKMLALTMTSTYEVICLTSTSTTSTTGSRERFPKNCRSLRQTGSAMVKTLAATAVAAAAASRSSASSIRKSTRTPAACRCPWSETLSAKCVVFPAAPGRLTCPAAAVTAAVASAMTTRVFRGTSGSPSDSTWHSARLLWSTSSGFAPCRSWLQHFRKRWDRITSEASLKDQNSRILLYYRHRVYRRGWDSFRQI